MKIKIIKDSNSIMRKRSLPVEMPLSSKDKETLDAMLDYLIKSQDEKYAEKHNIRAGVGMAAIQIGILKRMFVIYFIDEDGQEVAYQLVNPTIIESSVKKAALQGGEGCLSVDNPHYGLVHRSYRIKLKAYDALIGQDVEIDAKGYEAIVLQHEYDHLNGTFYYDRIDKNSPENPYPGEQII